MDRQHRPGGKYGQGVMMSRADENLQKKYRQKRLALEAIDLSKDPFFFKNHIGSFECRLCLTLHTNEASYLVHTQGRKHQDNLKRHMEREARENTGSLPIAQQQKQRPNYIKIGLPPYKIKRSFDPIIQQYVLNFEIEYKGIIENQKPAFKIANAYEQKMEPPDNRYLYVLFAADPYETMCIKIPNKKLDDSPGSLVHMWDKSKKIFFLTITYL